MAKIDVSQIKGFEEMSAEDKLNALMNLDLPEHDDTKLKNALSKSNSEAAEYKRKLQEKLSAEEKAEAERAEAQKKIEEELNYLRREKTIAEYATKVTELGMDSEMAKATAEAMADGQFSVVFDNAKTFFANERKRMQEDALKAQPSITAGQTPSAKNAEEAETAKLRSYFGLK